MPRPTAAPSHPSDTVPDGLADYPVLDASGAPHRLGEAWAERPAAIVWVRHFG